ncbi:lysophospholipid acyltransferase family protein [Lacinutrix undariae]
MRKILAYPLTAIYFVFFGLVLVIFHPIQWFCFNVFGYQAHKKSVDFLQFSIMRCTNLLGTRYTFTNPYDISTDEPIIIVANHQSMYDISPIIWYFRKHHVKFISKKELGKGIPSVSYNLRHGGSVLIDRKNPRQALPAIMKFGESIEKSNRAAAIFPEGTRSKDGTPRKFQTKGLEILFKKIPSATIVPVTINNSWKMLRYGKFPMGIGNHITITTHKPIKLATFTDREALINSIETTIISNIKL